MWWPGPALDPGLPVPPPARLFTCPQGSAHPISPAPGPDLADAAAARAGKHHGAAPVVVGRHSSQAVILVHEQGGALDRDRAPQRLVEILATEIIVDLQWLCGKGEGETLGPCSQPQELSAYGQ